MNEIDHFKFFVFYSGDVTNDVDHLHFKRIHLVDSSYIFIEDNIWHSLCMQAHLSSPNIGQFINLAFYPCPGVWQFTCLYHIRMVTISKHAVAGGLRARCGTVHQRTSHQGFPGVVPQSECDVPSLTEFVGLRRSQ
jgi:hypothetical protein